MKGPVVIHKDTPQDAAPLDTTAQLRPESNSETIQDAISETTSSAPIAQPEAQSEPRPEDMAQAASQEPELLRPSEIIAESEHVSEGAEPFDGTEQPSNPVIDMRLLDYDPHVHASLDASAEAFGSPQVPPTYSTVIDSEGSEADGPREKKDEQEAAEKESEVVEGMAKVLFEQYRTNIDAELKSYRSKVSEDDGQAVLQMEVPEDLSVTLSPPVVNVDVDAEPLQPPAVAVEEKIIISTEGKPVRVNKLNKNHDGFDGSQEETTSDSRDNKPLVLMHHHHHHVSNGSPKQQQKQKQELKQEQESINDSINILVANDDHPLVFSSPDQEAVPAVQKQLDQVDDEDEGDIQEEDVEVESIARPPPPAFPPTAVPPEELRNRGLIPSVKSAYHCTPQFCANVSLSDNGQFATFHVERDLEPTGWISLGIGYAMTTADLLIMWPNQDPASGGGPRGTTLSRRTSHAYVEPQLVSREEAEIKASGKGESLYPANEYILHNPSKDHGGGDVAVAMAAAVQVFPPTTAEGKKKFIVQFTRPVRTQNRTHKLTPGKEQDFDRFWAHITQHLSVGSFAMDVGANQPQLKEAILKQQEMDHQEAVIEKERKKWALEESNRRLADEERERSQGEGGKDRVSAKHKPSGSGNGGSTSDARNSSSSWLGVVGLGGEYLKGSSSSVLALQGFSCLVAMAFMWFFR
ncbi:hypothetical protein BGX23_006215 [Mortierella sp. AD031]|nr:hypothetical protein BGX23_006215 [Mortierella sp. AD031]